MNDVSCSKPLEAWIVGYDAEEKPMMIWRNRSKVFKPPMNFIEHLEIPCGQCVSCRLAYSRAWADRCMMELESHDSAYFLTLTYSNEFMNQDEQIGRTRRFYADPDTGEAKASLSLCKDDLTRFFKRLRRAYPDDHIRYFACGEYGDQTKRPHYHAIVFGLHLDDLKFYKYSGLKNPYYNSEKLDKVWSEHGMNIGHVVIGDVNWDTCAYVARYVMKKVKGIGSSVYDEFNMEKEYVVMSRKPGIGREYFDKHSMDFMDFGKIFLATDQGGKPVVPPRYFKTMMKEMNPERYAEIRCRGMSAASAQIDSKMALCNYELDEMREVEEQSLLMKTKALKREM